ncbi:MAG TPA: PrsW family glutamic-type intramembrane protease [Bryobacteraceae bacterium]|nr:PrsW family glutamic-type intramembrane protease [Bryobacteraceae bacterium]
MSPADQWYYLVGSETRGPVGSTQIAQLIKGGSLNASTQVAQAGWPNWSPASQALSHLLSQQPVMPQPVQQNAAAQAAAPMVVDTPIYAIKVQCVSGPDAGKAYMIGAAEVSLGRVSGIGQSDPQVAENHVVLSWQNNVLHFRTFSGARLRVAGVDVTQGSLSNGQQFQLGASTWQVGSAPVELTNLLGSLASRLNKLTSTEKLEGFSLTSMFSEVFKARKPGEIEDYFVVGTTKTTPPLDEVQTGWPKPWFFMRVLIFMLAVYFIFSKTIDVFGNPHLVPGLMVMGSLAAPLATAILFWELNTPRNVSFVQVLVMVCLGGVISLLGADVAGSISTLGWLGDPAAGIEEEVVKLVAVILVARNIKHKYILNGMVFGAAIGCGFAAFETAGYSFFNGFLSGYMIDLLKHTDVLGKIKSIDDIRSVAGALASNAYPVMFSIIESRSYLAPFGHVAWTAITAGALWRVKGANPFNIKMLIDPAFLRTFAIPVVLHMLWDTDLVQNQSTLVRNAILILLGFIAWYVAFLLVQQGLKQIKEAQLAQTRTEYTRTQQILTTSGRFRAGLARH